MEVGSRPAAPCNFTLHTFRRIFNSHLSASSNTSKLNFIVDEANVRSLFTFASPLRPPKLPRVDARVFNIFQSLIEGAWTADKAGSNN